MKLLLDENMPHRLRLHLPGHVVFTVAFMKWGGVRNGVLLAKAAGDGFDAVLTADSGIEYEQNVATLPCSVIIIRAESNAFEHIEPLIPNILESLKTLKRCSLVRVERSQ